MKLDLTGQSYEHVSRDANYQRCINLFPSPTGDENLPFVQLHTSGLKSIGEIPGNSVRALINFDSKLYAVVDQTVYKLTLTADKQSFTYSSIGNINESSGRISWARNPTQVIIVNGTNKGYILTPGSETLTQIADTDFTGGDTVVFLDGYFIVNAPGTAQMYASALNDGTSWNALDVATAEANPDLLKALIVDKREIWALGEVSTEVWFDQANPTGFPFSVRDGGVVEQGISAAFSASKANNTLLWLDDRRFVVQVEGYGIQPVTTPAVSAQFQSYSRVDDAFAFSFKDRGHYFYQLTFPSEGKTWVYDLSNKKWHERSYRNPATGEDTRHLANCYVSFQNLNLVGAYNSGKIFVMSGDYYDDNGDPVIRNRTTAHFTTELKQFSFNYLELHAENGKGTVTGLGSDPQINLRYSNDGGYTWSDYLPRSIGKLGEYGKRVRWNRLGSGREWLFELTYNEPTPLGLLELYADVSGDNNA